MKFIVLLLIFGMNRYWVGPHPLYREEWIAGVRGWLGEQQFLRAQGATARLVTVLGVPVVVTLLLFWLVRGWLLGLVWIAGAVIVVGFTVDLSRLSLRLQQHLQWLKGIRNGESAGDAGDYHRQFKRQMVYEDFEGLYTQVFWFMIVGPAGALLYRLAGFYATLDLDDDAPDDREPVTAGDLIQILEWVPARIAGLAFAVVGDFNRAVGPWVESLSDPRTPTVELLDRLANSAIAAGEIAPEQIERAVEEGESQVFQLRDLLNRSMICWLVLAALLVLVGWS